jgi:hypothetical protein
LGVVPLVIATGAGAEMRQALGLAVFSGMLGVTLFGVFLTPVFFYVIQGFSRAPAAQPAPAAPAQSPSPLSAVGAPIEVAWPPAKGEPVVRIAAWAPGARVH